LVLGLIGRLEGPVLMIGIV